MLILAGYVEEFMLLDQPLITLVEQIVNEPPEDAYGETYEGDSVNIPGGSGSGIGDWGKVLIAEDTIPSSSDKVVKVESLTIVFPKSSVKQNAGIQVYRVNNPPPIIGDWQPLVMYDVELSSSLEAQATMQIELDLSEIPEGLDLGELFSFADYVEAYNTWVLIQTKIEDGKLVAKVDHFSKKGVSFYAQKMVSLSLDTIKKLEKVSVMILRMRTKRQENGFTALVHIQRTLKYAILQMGPYLMRGNLQTKWL
ncbi:MAG: hypothetical protein QXF05_04515 [Thermofilaceae archaeon]